MVFGWSHFKLKSIDPYAAGLTQNPQPGYQIEIRQRYFHLLWIPCFPLGKKWALRKDGALYEMPEPYKYVLQERKDLHASTPWYTFAGPLIIAFIGICSVITTKVGQYRLNQTSAKQFAAACVENMDRFSHPSLHDYYVLVPVDGYNDKFAKVTGLDESNIQLSYIANSVYGSTPSDIANLFYKPGTTIKTITIDRCDPGRLICKQFEKRFSFEGITLPGERSTYRLNRVVRLDGPVLCNGRFTRCEPDAIHTELRNSGLSGELVAVETVEGEVEWHPQDCMPLALLPDESFVLVGTGNYKKPYKTELRFRNEAGEMITYLMSGLEQEKNFQRIN